ncbi:MAG TPA: M23 family metallopeptidase, partial [Flavisolibacter sp.]|nr:M23 family metallopeptidase [Flavisolibacter sp.]
KHQGIDIFAKKGTPVIAISDGIIVSRDKTPIGGRTLWLKSAAHSWTAYYAHLDKQLVKEGQYVRKGQVIGTVGKTGNARTTPPHLHFGIYTGKGAVNPLPYVKHSPKVSSAKKTTKKKATVSQKKVSRKKRTNR